jgi:hypothetical protein
MSYILDALKKAEEERRRHTGSDRQDGQKETSPPPRRRKLWPYLIFFVLLANTGLLVWWTEPWKAGTTVSVQNKSGENLSRTIPDKVAGLDTITSLSGDSSETKPSLTDTASTHPNSSHGEIEDKNIQVRVELKTTNESAGSGAIPTAAGVPSDPPGNQKEPPPGNRIYALDDLPPSVLHDLPDMSISLLYYTEDPKSRLISMKDKTLREGSELVPGLKLLGIDSDSAIFGYRNYLFRIAVNAK